MSLYTKFQHLYSPEIVVDPCLTEREILSALSTLNIRMQKMSDMQLKHLI